MEAATVKFGVHGVVGRVAGEGSVAHRAAKAMAQLAGFKACFAADVPMRTPTGHVMCQDVRENDLLLSRDEWNPKGLVVAQRVEEVFVREALILELKVLGRTIRTTAEHPFHRYEDGWVACNRLQVGDRIALEDGWAEVEGLVDTGSWETVYNFRIADFHTYFVGCDEWGFSVWAHNQYDARNSMPNRAKWEKKGGLVIENDPAPGFTTYIRKDGVTLTYNPQGHPDFGPHALATVSIGKQKGDHYHDFIAANKAVGMPEAGAKTPIEGTTWHHHENGVDMLLVPTSNHNVAQGGFPHAGGVSAGKP